MIQIKVTDLEIVQEEREKEVAIPQNTAKAIANLAVANKQKDTLIANLVQQVSNLNIKIAQMGGTK